MKPYKVFLFLLALFGGLALLSSVYPAEGLKINEDLTLDFPSVKELFAVDTTEKKDFSFVLETTFDIDSISEEEQRKMDSLRTRMEQDSIRQWQLKLHYPNGDKTILYSLFQLLDEAEKNPVRIMHYGDSQIEGDRITGFLRHKLQNKFGGNGPGLLAAAPLVRSAGIDHSNSDNWGRFTLYGKKDSLVKHSNFGILATYGRYAPIYQDSIPNDSIIYSGWISLKRSTITFPKTKYFQRFRMFYGNNQKSFLLNLYAKDSLIVSDSIAPGKKVRYFEHTFNFSPKEVRIEFSGKDSPDIYAFSLEGTNGVIVDNIAMRGSSGTIFRKLDRSNLQFSYAKLPIKLLVLQFGGNVMPYIEDEKEAEQYGKWFESQIHLLKTLIPDVSIIVIGPSDMGILENDEFTTYPLLTKVRDELKKATFKQNGVYWDLFEAMGGEKSMQAWVDSKPPLAGKDYVHFNHNGATKVAQMFYNALIHDYNEYKSLQSPTAKINEKDTIR